MILIKEYIAIYEPGGRNWSAWLLMCPAAPLSGISSRSVPVTSRKLLPFIF